MDAQSLMQQIQRIKNGESHTDLSCHPHWTVLLSIADSLYSRSENNSATHFIKVKSHAGSILNELADTLADAGRTAQLTGLDPIDQTAIQHTFRSNTGQQRYPNQKASNRSWQHKFQAQQYVTLDLQSTKTIQFMTRPNSGRQHIKAAVTQTTDEFNDTDWKRFLQAYTCSFPTNHKL
eukprot:1945726-Rhodomonas_salina.1